MASNMNKKNDNDIKMKNEENFKLDKRLSINNENICISSPRRNGRRNRSRRHLIYVPSLSNITSFILLLGVLIL